MLCKIDEEIILPYNGSAEVCIYSSKVAKSFDSSFEHASLDGLLLPYLYLM